MKKKGFTLVELLVVIAIIALLMGILMPALARVRQIAYRMICGTHLKGIGSSMLLYANDNGEDYPIAGPQVAVQSTTGRILNYQGTDILTAFGQAGRPATITSCLYMLIKNYDMTPAMFVCKGDSGAKEFKLSDTGTTVTSLALIWDFGGGLGTDYPIPGQYNSYAYHNPFKGPGSTTADMAYPINATSAPGSPVCSDRNPYLDKNARGVYLDGSAQPAGSEEAPSWAGDPPAYTDPDKSGNCAAHQREGQNVLYNDNHTSFEKFPNVGIQNDHIWKHWPDTIEPDDETRQVAPLNPTLTPNGNNGGSGNKPMSSKDAYLVSEKNF